MNDEKNLHKPFYKKTWFIVLIVVISIIILGSIGAAIGGKDLLKEKPKPEIIYEDVSIQRIKTQIELNPLRAKELFIGKHYKISGKIQQIHHKGKFIRLRPKSDDNADLIIECNINDESIKEKLKQFNISEIVTVKGEIKSIDNIFSVAVIDIVSIEKGIK